MMNIANFGDIDRNFANMQNFMQNDFDARIKDFQSGFDARKELLDSKIAAQQEEFKKSREEFNNSNQNDFDFDAKEFVRGPMNIFKNTMTGPLKGVAIGTGVPAIIALVALVVLAILFPPASLVFMIGVSVSAAALLAFGITSVVYGARAAQLDNALNLGINLNL